MQTIRVKIINQSSHPLPEYLTPGAAGMDIRAHLETEMVLQPGETALVPTGLSIELPEGFEAQIRPRSGLALKKGITLLNSPGTIDADYRGEIKIILINHSPSPQTIENGERIAQMVVAPVVRVEWVEADVLSATKRGSGGFGHTGRY